MDEDLRGRTAIVTGGAGGMGRAHALRLAAAGADVAVFDIDLHVGRRWAETLTAASVDDEIRAHGVRSIAVEVDLVDAAATRRAVDRVAELWDGIDILVNNAGGAVTPYEHSTATTTSETDVIRVLEVNLVTVVNCCRASAPHLRRPGASIINIATGAVDRDVAGGRLALYAAAKSAVVRYTRSLALELGPEGVRVNAIAPGLIETARITALANDRPAVGRDFDDRVIPLRRRGSEADVSDVVAFLAGSSSRYMTGECLRVDGGMGLTPAGSPDPQPSTT